jgi:hypothetical protein
MDGPLLVPGEVMLHLRVLEKLVIDVKDGASRVTEHNVDA